MVTYRGHKRKGGQNIKVSKDWSSYGGLSWKNYRNWSNHYYRNTYLDWENNNITRKKLTA